MKSVEILGDPCPLPDVDSEKRRKLSEKQKFLIHAPMSDVGGVTYDKDAVWINVPGSFTRGNADSTQHVHASFMITVLIVRYSPSRRG